jgi:peptide-methionine (R)-S-oxide reductase
MTWEEKMGKEKIVLSEEEWRRRLTPEQYYVLRQAGTEPAFTGKYYKNHETGVYACAGCGEVLFTSDTKYESGSGWPSFWDAVDEQKLELLDDYSHGMHRIEVRCAKCGGHLGHLFDDGPRPTGKRYCINSASLQFHKKEHS